VNVYAVGIDVEETLPPMPYISCTINGEIFCNALYDIGAHVSVMSSRIYDELYSYSLNLALTSAELFLGDGEIVRPLGVLNDIDVAISGKIIPTDFFVTDGCHDEHDDIILGRPFVKLLNAVLDTGKGKVTINTDGTNYTYDFLPTSRQSLALSPDNEEVEDVYFAESFRDPLQRAIENAHNKDPSEELKEAAEALAALDGILEEESYEQIADMHQEEPKAPVSHPILNLARIL